METPVGGILARAARIHFPMGRLGSLSLLLIATVALAAESAGERIDALLALSEGERFQAAEQVHRSGEAVFPRSEQEDR